MRRALRPIALAATVLGAVVATAGPAVAASIAIRSVEASDFPEVRMTVRVDGERPSTGAFRVIENGRRVPSDQVQVRPLADSSRPIGTVLVIDTSGSMRAGGAMDAAKAAARQFIASRLPTESIAVVGFASQPQVVADFTQDAALLGSVVDGLVARGETALWDALARGAALLDRRPELQPNLVLLSDGGDTVSSLDQQAALAAVNGARATVMAIGLRTSEFDPLSLRSVVGDGGLLVESADPGALADAFGRVRGAIESQFEIVYTSSADPGTLTLAVEAGALRAEATTRAGSDGPARTPKTVRASPSADNPLWKVFIALLVFLSVGALVIAGALFFTRDEERVGRRLAMYGARQEDHDRGQGQLLPTGVLARGVDFAEERLAHSSMLVGLERLLDRAYMPLRPAEALVAYTLGVAVAGILLLVLAPSAFLALVLTAAVAIGPIALLQFRVGRQSAAFAGQLPDTLQLLGASLRAGYSLLQGVEALGEQTSDPMHREIRRVLAEARLGRPVEDALGDVADRMGSRDFAWAVVAIRIQREVGGNLAEVLDTVAETMVERDRLRREVRSLTAEGRISAIVMGLLPFGLALMLVAASPGYLDPLIETGTGKLMVSGSAALGGVGALWLRKIVRLDF